MKKFDKITSQVVPIPRKDIDTDIIIPAQFLTSTKRKGFGRALFSRFRNNPDFKYFKKFRKAKIIVAQENFGCGSSREHAVW
ncbi:3-isopropylmalate dehydratase small subunit 2, partial [Patescibacteria group bacterium]